MNDTITTGSKYDRSLTTTEVAQRVRAEIKENVKAGFLPALRYSVRTAYFSGGSSIDVKVMDYTGPRHRAQGIKMIVKAMLDRYNFDGSDPQTDYYHVNFYGHVEMDWQTTTFTDY